MRINIVLNPAGGSGGTLKLWRKLEPVFKEQGCDYKLYRSTPSCGIGELCRRLTSSGQETALVVIGGDGSLNEAVNGIKDFEHTRFGFIPCGTGNDMARDMSLPKKKDDIVRRLADCSVKRISDIGELTFYGEEGVVKRRFNISSDIGFGAATCALVNRSRIKPVLNRIGLGRLIYLIEAVRVCFTMKPTPVKISADGKVSSYRKCLCVIAMNHRCEGGGFRFCPEADFTDGRLDVVIGDGLSHLEFLRMLPYAYMGRHLKLRGISLVRAEKVTMLSASPIWAHTDGEVLGKTKKVSVKIIPQKLQLMI